MNRGASPVSVDQVIVSAAAPAPGVLRKSAKASFLALSETLVRDPSQAAQSLVEEALRFTGAGSAGITVEDSEKPDEIFRWVAVAGEFSRYLNGTMPRHFSPCGEVLRRQQTLLMKDLARHYAYIADLHAPIRSALLVPFARQRRFVGTLWVLSHAGDAVFTTDDAATVEVLSTFVETVHVEQIRH